MVPGCMRTDGHEKIVQEELIGKRTSPRVPTASLLSGKGHCHTRFYFDEHDILVLSTPGALVCNEKPIFVDNFWVVCYLSVSNTMQ